MNRTKFVLFICLSVRYHYTREVATHENPERTKDGHRVRSSKPADCKGPGSVGSDQKVRGRKQAPGRRSVQRSRGIGGEGAFRVKRQCANRRICAGGRLYLRPATLIRELKLRCPMYAPLAVYGHFGRADINPPWEETGANETALLLAVLMNLKE